ncbi:MAG TPA: 5'/3'-nucleotidase SurE [Bryobacteraceae bacterium]|nr:5'/3'-nucleotidase SurE [Bryobacteraceae bacterium]
MARPQILLTNDDGWDAPGLAALATLAARLGDIYVVAPRDPHSYAGHRVTTDQPMTLASTAPNAYHLSGTPADCVRVALTALLPDIDWVISGINRGGNLGVDIYSSGTVAAAREAAFLGKPAIAVSQYVRRDIPLNWGSSIALAEPVLARLLANGRGKAGEYWNVNLPHLEESRTAPAVECLPDDGPLDVQFRRDGNAFHYAGAYSSRPQRAGRDVEYCFQGAVTISRLPV